MKILGISCYYHDSAAALISDGKVISAAEEERFSRKKHDSGFPKNAIDFCLSENGLSAKDLDYVVFYEKPFRKFHRIIISSLSTYPRSYTSFREAIRLWITKKLWVKDEIASQLGLSPDKILFSEHHLSHAASCFFPSPFDEAAILTVDGVGEWSTASYGVGKGHKFSLIRELQFPYSIGLLYSAFTSYLGFEVNEGEWKVMGLSPYGKPKYTSNILKLMKIDDGGDISLDFSYFSYHYSDSKSVTKKFSSLFGPPPSLNTPKSPNTPIIPIPQKFADIAASIQQVTETVLVRIAQKIRRETCMDNLCLSGGVALNSVANYRILRKSGFRNMYIQPAPGDSGSAIGAALYLYHQALGNKKRYVLDNAYLGKEYKNDDIKAFISRCHCEGVPSGTPAAITLKPTPPYRSCLSSFPIKKSSEIIVKKLSTHQLLDYVSSQISRGKVIGWMQGKFEWGPRALGNRSILADPRNPRMKDIINRKVKFRETFRPFAPSVLAEHAPEIFELPPNPQTHLPLNFMLYVVPVKKEWRNRIPAVNHEGNTARPQLVYRQHNHLFYQLISAFFKKTGVPLILNTSFNLKGEPIVNTPQNAYSTYQKSGIDILVMGNYIVEKSL